MIFRLDTFTENNRNPITGEPYDDGWAVFVLTDSTAYSAFVGSVNGCAYTIKRSRHTNKDWQMSLCDFIGYNESIGKNMILVLSEESLKEAQSIYAGHNFQEAGLRAEEPRFLVHSTSLESYRGIQKDGMLKSFNHLEAPGEPIGRKLGDPKEFGDYIMFSSGGVTGEIVVNSRQQGKITMDVNSRYSPGARLYFDAERIAADGLLIRDGCHLKVKDCLPLEPYLIYTATAESVGLKNGLSTPKEFSELADAHFHNASICTGFLPLHSRNPML